MKLLRALGLRLGLLLLATAGALLAAELYARLIWRPVGAENLLFNAPAYSPVDLYAGDPEFLLLPTPGFEGTVATAEYHTVIRINDQGLRGPPLGPKPEGALRLLAVGDSFALSVQVSEQHHFTTLLAEALSERLGRPVEILNAGVDGYGTLQALGRLEQFADTAAIDGAIFLFFLGNDIFDNVTYSQLSRGRQGTFPRTRGRHPRAAPTMQSAPNHPSIPRLQRFLAQHSYLYAIYDVRRKAADPDPQAIRRFRSELEIFQVGSNALERHMVETARDLKLVEERCAVRGLRCFLPLAPAAFMVERERADETFALVGLDPARVDLDAPARAVLAAAPEGLPSYDLTPGLRERADEGLYFIFDGHWTEAGHAAVAQLLADWMAPLLAED